MTLPQMGTLKELIELGFSPMMALVVVAIVVLWGALGTVIVIMWRQWSKERTEQAVERVERDKLKDAWHAEVDARLKASEIKHDVCDKDRDRLQKDLEDVRGRVTRFESCTAGTKCPMRLP